MADGIGADRIDVDFTDLHISARQLSSWHGESARVFDSGHTEIDDATSSGWVGDSRLAMESALEKMRHSAGALVGHLGSHSEHFGAAVPVYTDAEVASSGELIRATADIPFTLGA